MILLASPKRGALVVMSEVSLYKPFMAQKY